MASDARIVFHVSELLRRCGSPSSILPPTALYNEGWMLRLFLDWFDHNRSLACELSFLPEARWYSEALLSSPFLPRARRDPLGETFTQADGMIGHFTIRPGERGEAVLLSDPRQFVIIEAKLGSGLSEGVKNAPTYDQAARNVACMAYLLAVAQVEPKLLDRIGFYVIAPQSQIEGAIFRDLVTKPSIHRKVEQRVGQYSGSRDAWFRERFEPLLERIDIGLLSWESIIDLLPQDKARNEIQEFYTCCLRFNPLRMERRGHLGS